MTQVSASGRTTCFARVSPPTKGQHTEEILAEFGYTEVEIADFAARDVT